MMGMTYKARAATVEAVRYDGTNADEVAGLAVVLPSDDGALWVESEPGPCEVHPGWWVSQAPDGQVCVHSAQAWDRFWEPAP